MTYVAMGGVLLILLLLLWPAFQRPTHRPMHPCMRNLRKIALALHAYHGDYGSFPPAYVADSQGRKLHSWRVMILPYLGEEEVFREYDMAQSWDRAHNLQVAERSMSIYRCPNASASPVTRTNYLAVVGASTAWPGENSTTFDSFRDGPSNTLLVVEVLNAGIDWSEPRDLDVEWMQRQINPPIGQGISSNHVSCAMVVFADGHVRCLLDNISPTTLEALLTPDGGEQVRDQDF